MTDRPRCVYTALIGQYEALNEQPAARESKFPFICFTDDPSLRSDTWEVRPINPRFKLDSVRSQREIKLQPHRYLPDFSASLYIDNSVILTEPPECIFKRYEFASGMALPPHSFRNSVMDEFQAVHESGFDDPTRILEQLNHYALSRPDVLEQKPYWGGIQLRDHENRAVRDLLDAWLAHVLRYSRRDQLSANYVMAELGFTPDLICIDNIKSWFHTWPVRLGRAPTSPRRWLDPLVQPAARLRNYQNDIGTLQVYHETLEAVLASIDPEMIEGATIQERLAHLRPFMKESNERRRRLKFRRIISSIGRRLSGRRKT